MNLARIRVMHDPSPVVALSLLHQLDGLGASLIGLDTGTP